MPVPALFLASGITQYLGAGLAVHLFTTMPAAAVAWSRIALAALVLIVLTRPWRSHWSRRSLGRAALFGVVLAAMNVCFYLAIEHLPLGTAVAIEFVGPVVVGALTGRGWRDRAGLILATVGVVLIAGVTLDSGGPGTTFGLVMILCAAAFWALYIVLGRRVAIVRPGEPSGVTALSISMLVGALVFAPFLAAGTAPAWGDWQLLATLFGVAVLSSVVPYGIDQIVLRSAGTARFSVLLSIFPATALLIGAVVLHQWPHGLEIVGLVCVSVAILLVQERRDPNDDAVLIDGE